MAMFTVSKAGVLTVAGITKKGRIPAIQDSIKKWRAIEKAARAGIRTKSPGDHCPLCQQFHGVANDWYACVGCPVEKMTGVIECAGTPFRAYRGTRSIAKALRAATAERIFLQAVLALEKGGE